MSSRFLSNSVGSSLADSLLVLPTTRRGPDELGVVAGLVGLMTRHHGAGSVGFFRAVEGGGYDSVTVVRETFNGVVSRRGIGGMNLSKYLPGKVDDLVGAIGAEYERFRESSKVDFAVVEGFWAPDHSQGYLQDVNARLAMRIGSVVVAGVDAQGGTAAEVGTFGEEIVNELNRRLVSVAGIVVVGASGGKVGDEMKRRGLLCAGVLPVDRLLSSLTMQDISSFLPGELLCGEQQLQQPIDRKNTAVATSFDMADWAHRGKHVPKNILLYEIQKLGGFTSLQELATAVGSPVEDLRPLDYDRDGYVRSCDILDYNEGALILCSADRIDVVTSILLSELSGETGGTFSGILVCGDMDLSAAKEAIASATRAARTLSRDFTSKLPPILAVQTTLYATVKALGKVEPRITLRSTQKIKRTIQNFNTHVDSENLITSLRAPKKDLMTPDMFQHQFLSRAAKAQRRIVLPEGTEPRIILAAGELLQHGTARLTLLGKEKEIRSIASELNVNLDAADIIDPESSDRSARYVEEFVNLRKHKGVTADMARDTLHDANYFGTMMVKCGDADGMVSGSVHTTAATVRPALQLIKTKPGISIVSSIFFMCLPEQVLVYGDCAINPNPTSEQLAQIAVTSAHTSMQFGIVPRVALLSFSSGDEDSQPVVRKVSEAVHLARELDPDLAIFGPIQYDAAVRLLTCAQEQSTATRMST